MEKIILKEAIEHVITKYRLHRNTSIKTLFSDKQFYRYECASMYLTDPMLYDKIDDAVQTLCKSYTRKKTVIVENFKKVFYYIQRDYGYCYKIETPDIDYSDPIQRKLYMLKYFHPDTNHTFEQYTKCMWMFSEETLLDDLRSINNGELSFLGKDITLTLCRNRGIVTTSSTCHPIIMVENLTQILTQLEGLRRMSHGAMKYYALNSAKTIWSQVSDYARNRILFVVKELLDIDTDFYSSLQTDNELFYDEVHCSDIKGTHGILKFLKNNEPFYIAYYHDNKLIKRYCKMNKFVGVDTVNIIDLDTQEIINIKEEDIICSASSKDEFINYLLDNT